MLQTLRRLAEGERVFIVCIGDSITEQNYHLQGRLNYVGQLTERLMELYNRRSRVLNAGKSSDTTQGILERLDYDALRFQPDLTTVMIGMNDAYHLVDKGGVQAFKSNLEQIVRRIVESGSEILLLTPNMLNYNVIEGAVTSRAEYPAYVEGIREVASRLQIPLCDIYRNWEEYVGGRTNDHLMLMHDSIHPGELGHNFMANAIYQYLGIATK